MATPKAQTLQQRFGFLDPELTTPKHDEIMLWLDANAETVIKNLFPKYSVSEKIWEYAVVSEYNNFPIGFIDMKMRIYFLENFSSVYFEIKPSIPSLGQVIRQIRMYEEYVGQYFYIVSPDDRFQQPLAAQGIGFVKYPG